MRKAFLTLGALALAGLSSAWGYDYEMIVTQVVENVKIPYTWSFDVNHNYVNDDPACKYVTIKKVTPKLIGDQSIPNAFHYFNTDVLLFVKEIGDGAFANSYGLTSVTIPQTIETIGDYAFSGCTSLTSVDLGTGLRYIGKAPFGNTQVKAITLPDTLLDMAGNISAGAIYAININIGENSHFVNTEDGLLLNKDETRLYACATRAEGTVELPDTLQEIKDDAFFGCFRLESLEIPAGVKKIGVRAFNVNGIWPGLTAPESTPKLMAVSYLGTNPNAIAVPEDAADYIYAGAPEELTSYAYASAWVDLVATGWQGRKVSVDYEAHNEKEEDGTGLVWAYEVYDGTSRLGGNGNTPVIDQTTTGDVIIPAQLGGRDVVEIGASAFEGCKTINSLHIPATVTKIDASAFIGCTNLSAFVVDTANSIYYAENGVLYKRGAGIELVKVPAKFPFKLQAVENTTEGEVTIREVVNGVAIVDGAAVFYPNDITVEDAKTTRTVEIETLFEPVTTEATLLRGVSRIADYAFSDCGHMPCGSLAHGTLTRRINGEIEQKTGPITLPVGTDSVSTSQVTTNILESFVINNKAAWRKRIVGTQTTVVSKTVRPDTTGITCGTLAWANSFWEKESKTSTVPVLESMFTVPYAADFVIVEPTQGNLSNGSAIKANGGIEQKISTGFDTSTVKSVKAQGLPSGLKLKKITDKLTKTATWYITGMPKKNQQSTVTLTVKHKDGKTEKIQFVVETTSIPNWLPGESNGAFFDIGANAIGVVTAKITASGKLNGIIKTASDDGKKGMSYPFSMKNLTSYDPLTDRYLGTATLKIGREKRDAEVICEENKDGTGLLTLKFKDGSFAKLSQNIWKRNDLIAPTYSTQTIERDGFTFKFGAKGKVKWAGYVIGDDGRDTKISGTSQLDNNARGLLLYAAPKKNLFGGRIELIEL